MPTALPLLAAAQSLFVAALLAVHRTGPRVGNRLLAAYFLIFGLAMARIASHSSGYIVTHPHLALGLVPLELLYGPLFYLYVRLLTGHSLAGRDLRHGVPAVAMLLVLTPFFLWSADAKLAFILTPTPRQKQATFALWALNWLLLSAYLVAAMRQLRLHGARLRRNLSSIGREGLTWLRAMGWVLAVGQLLDLLATMATFREGAASEWWSLSAFAIVALLYVMAFFALRQPDLRYAPPRPVTRDPVTGEWARPEAPAADAVVVPVDVAADEEGEITGKYGRSGLSEPQALQIAGRITTLLDQQRLHVRTDLSLADLAALVGAPSHHVSQVLNERLGGSFFDVVNGRRVAEAKRMLSDPRKTNLSVLTIAFDAGFNSKTAFNTAFKAATGTTPTAFRKEALGPR